MWFHELYQSNFIKFTTISVSWGWVLYSNLSYHCRCKYDPLISRFFKFYFWWFLQFGPAVHWCSAVQYSGLLCFSCLRKVTQFLDALLEKVPYQSKSRHETIIKTHSTSLKITTSFYRCFRLYRFSFDVVINESKNWLSYWNCPKICP